MKNLLQYGMGSLLHINIPVEIVLPQLPVKTSVYGGVFI
jgi:hypothetical protein